MKKAGAERVSITAMEALRTSLEAKGLELASKASVFAQHAGRRTIMKQDVELASDEMK